MIDFTVEPIRLKIAYRNILYPIVMYLNMMCIDEFDDVY